MKKVHTRRTDTEPSQVGDFYDGIKRYYDQNMERTIVKLMTGDCYVTDDVNEMLVTILGSCVSVCVRDPIAMVGGMNHILLPGNKHTVSKKIDPGFATRFGAFAMEELINGVLKLGGKKERLEIKLFGGGNVINNSAMIGTKNVKFVHEYLKNEGLKIVSEDVGGDRPRRIHYFPDTGKVMMRVLKRKEDMRIVEEEKKVKQQEEKQGDSVKVELF